MSGADKLGYLIRALSRTKRKDYENYVVNAIWNRLAMGDVKPVTQQLVLWPDGRRSFVDLYFPQAMIGVECDEAYHQGQRERDREREITITDVLRQIRGEDYRALHVDVSGSYEQVERSIDDCVRRIRAEIERRRQANEFTPWTEAYVDYKEFYKTRTPSALRMTSAFPNRRRGQHAVRFRVQEISGILVRPQRDAPMVRRPISSLVPEARHRREGRGKRLEQPAVR